MKIKLTIDKEQKTLNFEQGVTFSDVLILGEIFDTEKINDWTVNINKKPDNYVYTCDMPQYLVFEGINNVLN